MSVRQVTNKPIRIRRLRQQRYKARGRPREHSASGLSSGLQLRRQRLQGCGREQRRAVPDPHRVAAADDGERRHVPGRRAGPPGTRCPGAAGRARRRAAARPCAPASDDVAEGTRRPSPVALVTASFLVQATRNWRGRATGGARPGRRARRRRAPAARAPPGPRRRPAGARGLIAVPRPRRPGLRATATATRSPECVTECSNGRPGPRACRAAGRTRRAGPVEAHRAGRWPAYPASTVLASAQPTRKRSRSSSPPVGRPALAFGIVQEPGEAGRGVLPARPPDVGGPVVRAGQFGHLVSLTAARTRTGPPSRSSRA